MLGGHSGGRCVPLWPDWHCLPRAFNPLLRFVHFSLPGTHMFSKVFQLQARQGVQDIRTAYPVLAPPKLAADYLTSFLPRKFSPFGIQQLPASASTNQHQPASSCHADRPTNVVFPSCALTRNPIWIPWPMRNGPPRRRSWCLDWTADSEVERRPSGILGTCYTVLWITMGKKGKFSEFSGPTPYALGSLGSLEIQTCPPCTACPQRSKHSHHNHGQRFLTIPVWLLVWLGGLV